MKQPTSSRRAVAGFTLIELMIAAGVSSILASVAYPSFSGVMQKTRRTDALVAMLQIQQAQERWRTNASAYGTLAEVGVVNVTPGGRYTLSVAAASASGYEALAVAAGSQAADRACRYMKLSVETGNASTSSGETAAVANNAQANRQCWNQ